jgi:predicted nucleic acid-binding protein
MERWFLDTNVLVYADDLDAGYKTGIARDLLRESIETRRGVLSTQVLQEYFVVATRKLDVDSSVARRKVELLATLDVVRIDVPDVLGAVDAC